MTRISPVDLPDELARFAESQVSSGRFASVADVLRAGVETLRAISEARTRALKSAWDEGEMSLRLDGPQLESDEEFERFMDDAEAAAIRQ